jgi:uracil-DNA glycosylase
MDNPTTYNLGITPIINSLQDKLTKGGWWPFFMSDHVKTIINKIDEKLILECKNNAVIYPQPSDVFNAMIYTSLSDMKVCLIGQDPYHSPNAAMGLAFSHPPDYNSIQPSLKNIYKELEDSGYNVNHKSGDLVKWAKQGVFLINTALTVRKGEANSHKEIWGEFTKALLKYISDNTEHIVVIMWGKPAQSYVSLFNKNQKDLKDQFKHMLLMCPHPSPFSAHTGFFGSNHFKKANVQLIVWHKDEIDWNL